MIQEMNMNEYEEMSKERRVMNAVMKELNVKVSGVVICSQKNDENK